MNKKRDEGQMLTRTELVQNIADHLCLSEDSVNNYKKGHNGPASIDVVKRIAAYLEMDWTDLMKEVLPMAEVKMMTMEKKIEMATGNSTAEQEAPVNNGTFQFTEYEKQSAWNAVREIYKALLVFVGFFEGDYSMELVLKDISSDSVIRAYNYCWTILHRHMLDIPDQTYEQLEELIMEMEYWIYGLPAVDLDDIDPTAELYRLNYFTQLKLLGLNEEMGVEPDKLNEKVTEWVVKEFYIAIRNILKNCITREPAEGGACPQAKPVKPE